MKLFKIALTVALITTTSCVTRPFTIDDQHNVIGTKDVASHFVPGLTQMRNGEYLKGAVFMLGTAAAITGTVLFSIDTDWTMVEIEGSSNPEPVDRDRALSALSLGATSVLLWTGSIIDAVYSTDKLNEQKHVVLDLGLTWEKYRLAQKEAERQRVIDERIAYLKGKYGLSDEDCQRVLDKKIWIGMSEDVLLESWGKPNRINRTVSAYTVHKQYVYGRFPYNSIVYVVNGVVTTLQD
jgi:hypothetical protein